MRFDLNSIELADLIIWSPVVPCALRGTSLAQHPTYLILIVVNFTVLANMVHSLAGLVGATAARFRQNRLMT